MCKKQDKVLMSSLFKIVLDYVHMVQTGTVGKKTLIALSSVMYKNVLKSGKLLAASGK